MFDKTAHTGLKGAVARPEKVEVTRQEKEQCRHLVMLLETNFSDKRERILSLALDHLKQINRKGFVISYRF